MREALEREATHHEGGHDDTAVGLPDALEVGINIIGWLFLPPPQQVLCTEG